MAITAETRTQLIGLSVAMLGQAPGADRLNMWVADVSDGMSVDDLANHIAETEAFQTEYPSFLTNMEFAEAFLGSLLHGLSDELMMAAVELVTGLLDGGMTRGSLALAIVDAMYDIHDTGMDHAAYGDLGMSANALANQVEVATYYTLNKRMADPSAEAIAGVTDDAATVETAKQHIDSPPADAMFDMVGELSLHENADGSGMPGDDNGPIGVGHVTASDSNGDMVTYSIAGDPEDWAILEDGKLCYIGTGVDYEMGSSIDLEIVATSTGADGTETSVSQMVTVMVGDVQESDAVFNDVGTLSIEENQAMGMVGSVTAMDAEDDPVTYRLADGSHAGFSIDEMTGAISYEGDGLDYESTPTVDLTVIATSTGANNMATDVSQMVTVMVGDVDDLPDEPMTYVLTPTIDNFTGGGADDTFVAQPEQGASNIFQETLSPFDSVDGGEGSDTIYIYGVDPAGTLNLGSEDISNVENVVLNTVGAIVANMSSWDGLEAVDLRRFGNTSDVTINVDGAMVSTDMTFGGDVTLTGVGGAVDIEADDGSAVVIGTGSHTESVTVKGGASVSISKNGASIADANDHKGGQSESVTSVSVIGVEHNTGTLEPPEPSGTFVPMTNNNGFVVGQNGSTQISITAGGSGGTATTPVGVDDDGVTLTAALTGNPIPGGTYSWNDDGDSGASATTPLAVIAELKFDVDSGGLVFGDIISIDGTSFSATQTEITVRDGQEGEKSYKADAIDGMRVPASVAYTSQDIGKMDADPGDDVEVGGGPTLTVNSDAIADLSLASTTATILVYNNSMTEDEKAMPEDLSITVDKYGDKDTDGKLCIAGAGSAENIMLTVAGDSWVDLNSNVVKMLDINADAKLSLSVSKFKDGKPTGASETLAGVMVSGEGAVSMNSLADMKKLASIDASGSSGNNSFKSDAELAALTMVMGGSGNDTVSLMADEDGKLESISTGDGNDKVTIAGDYREDGLMVDLGAGNDSFDGNAGNSMSRVDGGDGMDTLKLSADGATYKDADDKAISIYSNFEVLDAGGGSGPYNVGRLGVDSIEIGETTEDGGVELNNVAAGTSLSVSSSRSTAGVATATSATVEYNLAEAATSAGSLIGGGSNSILNVSLMAMGGKGDSKGTQTGAATLTLTADSNLRGVIIDSNAGVHGTAAGKGASSGLYKNTVSVTGSSIEEIKITGNAQTDLSGAGLASLEYVNAVESGGDVIVNAAASANALTLIGSQKDDTLTAGANPGLTANTANTLLGNGGNDTLVSGGVGLNLLVGGAGGDTLRGGNADGNNTGIERFVYNAASESQLSFKKGEDDDGKTIYTAEGYDTIENFGSGATGDALHFSKALHAIVTAGQVVTGVDVANGIKSGDDDWDGWMPTHLDNDGDTATPSNNDDDGDPATRDTAESTTSIDGDKVGLGDAGALDVDDNGATDLREFIGDGKGLFLTSNTVTGGTFGSVTTTYKNSIAVIEQEMGTAGTEDKGDGIWLLFDIDGDGDFDLDTDMVIFIAGDAAVFNPATDISM